MDRDQQAEVQALLARIDDDVQTIYIKTFEIVMSRLDSPDLTAAEIRDLVETYELMQAVARASARLATETA